MRPMGLGILALAAMANGVAAAEPASAYRTLLPGISTRDSSGNCIAGRDVDVLRKLTPETPDEIANPILTSKDDLAARGCECQAIDDTLGRYGETIVTAFMLTLMQTRLESAGDVGDPAVSALQRAVLWNKSRKLCRQFLQLAVPMGHDGLYLVGERLAVIIPARIPLKARSELLEVARGEVSRQVREWASLDLPLPRGLIVLRVVANRDELAKLADASPKDRKDADKRAGVTFPCRFMVIPWENSRQQFSDTLRHELVHVFANATAGYTGSLRVPRWFHEGLAVFMADDPGHRVLSVRYVPQSNGTVITETITSDTDNTYMRYRGYFDFLRGRFGSGALATFVRRVLTGDGVLETLAGFGIRDEQMLDRAAESWLKAQWYVLALFWSAAALVLVTLWFCTGLWRSVSACVASAVFWLIATQTGYLAYGVAVTASRIATFVFALLSMVLFHRFVQARVALSRAGDGLAAAHAFPGAAQYAREDLSVLESLLRTSGDHFRAGQFEKARETADSIRRRTNDLGALVEAGKSKAEVILRQSHELHRSAAECGAPRLGSRRDVEVRRLVEEGQLEEARRMIGEFENEVAWAKRTARVHRRREECVNVARQMGVSDACLPFVASIDRFLQAGDVLGAEFALMSLEQQLHVLSSGLA